MFNVKQKSCNFYFRVNQLEYFIVAFFCCICLVALVIIRLFEC